MAIITIPLLGYAPDLDPAQPGVLTYCYGIESSVRGWKLSRLNNATYSSSALTFASGSFVLDGMISNVDSGTEVQTVAVYDKTANKYQLFVQVGGALVNKSRAAEYTFAGVENFSFCQYGNYTLATNLVDVLQIRDATTTNLFADSAATGIPKAKICVTWGPPTSPRVMLLHYNDGTAYADGWWTSPQGGPASAWTPDIATGAANGRLLGTNIIRCGIAYRDGIVVWGDRTMWLGQFVGPPAVVEWTRISDEVGCVGPAAARVLNGVLYWVGAQGLFMWNGSGLPQKAPFPIQRDIIHLVAGAGANARMVQMTVDGSGQRLLVAMRGGGYTASLLIVTWYSINVLNNRVGVLPLRNGASSPFTMCALDRTYSVNLVVNDDITMTQEISTPNTAALTDLYGFQLSNIGSDAYDTKLVRLLPRFVVTPVSYRVVNYYGKSMGEMSNTTASVDVTASPWRADLLQTARWHGPRFYFSSPSNRDFEILDVLADVTQAGKS